MYILIGLIAIILLFYKFCVTKPPPNFPPGPRFNVPIINTNVVEAYNLLIGKDEIEKHKEYRKKYVISKYYYSLFLHFKYLEV